MEPEQEEQILQILYVSEVKLQEPWDSSSLFLSLLCPWLVSQMQPYPAHCRNTLFLPWAFHLFGFNIVLQRAHHSIACTKRATT